MPDITQITKNIQIKSKNAEGTFDLLFPKTKALIVELNDGKNVEDVVSNILTTLSSKATLEDLDQKIQDLIGAAPESLDTLKELADALNNDANFASTITNMITSKVEKIEGKQLSTEDFTTELLNKLTLIKVKEDGTVDVPEYVHPETHPATMIVEDETHRFITDLEKSKWKKINLSNTEDSEADIWFEPLV